MNLTKIERLEYALMLAAAAAIFCCAIAPMATMNWWAAAFEPLCGELATDGQGGEIILRSRLWELLREALG